MVIAWRANIFHFFIGSPKEPALHSSIGFLAARVLAEWINWRCRHGALEGLDLFRR
jgi:hypothetical protein